jgi:hypothetical protein
LARAANAKGTLAQALADLGVLSKSTGEQAAARACFDEARAIATELGAKMLIGRIDAALRPAKQSPNKVGRVLT